MQEILTSAGFKLIDHLSSFSSFSFLSILSIKSSTIFFSAGVNWYIGETRTKHLIICPRGHEYEVSYANFQQGSRCPYCRTYYSELISRAIFEKIFSNHKFKKCRPNFLGGLELDGYCKELNIDFEYNGIQHYEYVKHFHRTLEGFEEQKERDIRKQQISHEFGIFLCVIPNTYSFRYPEKMEIYIREWL